MSEAQSDDILRLFIALPLDEEVRGQLARCQDHFRGAGARVSWVPPANVHLTLVFLGDTVKERLPDLVAVVAAAGAESPPFSFEVNGLGTFGSARNPRVIWVGVSEPGGALAALHASLITRLTELGLATEKRAFKPHLTLGRVRVARGVDTLTTMVASAKNSPHGWVRVDQLYLMRSRLEPQGARYSILHTSRLGGHAHGFESRQTGN